MSNSQSLTKSLPNRTAVTANMISMVCRVPTRRAAMLNVAEEFQLETELSWGTTMVLVDKHMRMKLNHTSHTNKDQD